MNLDGSEAKPLTNFEIKDGVQSSVQARDAKWSPNGKTIAYQSDRNLTKQDPGWALQVMNIFLMNADGSNQRALTTRESPPTGKVYCSNFDPSFSPDSKEIVYVSDCFEKYYSKIFRIKTKSSNQHQPARSIYRPEPPLGFVRRSDTSYYLLSRRTNE